MNGRMRNWENNTRTGDDGEPLWTFNSSIPALTPETCVQRCRDAPDGPFEFAGLEAGQNCWCDNSYDAYGVHTKNTYCKVP